LIIDYSTTVPKGFSTLVSQWFEPKRATRPESDSCTANLVKTKGHLPDVTI